MEWLARISSNTKIKYGLKLLGLSGEEKEAVDALIADTTANPLVEFALGANLTSIEDVIDFAMAKSENVSPEVIQFGKMLEQKSFRMMLGTYIHKHMMASPNSASLERAMAKLAEFELAPWNHMDFSDVPSFLAEGPLALLAEYVSTRGPADNSDGSTVTTCPHCQFVHQI